MEILYLKFKAIKGLKTCIMFPADFNIEILFDKYVNLVLSLGWE